MSNSPGVKGYGKNKVLKKPRTPWRREKVKKVLIVYGEQEVLRKLFRGQNFLPGRIFILHRDPCQSQVYEEVF